MTLLLLFVKCLLYFLTIPQTNKEINECLSMPCLNYGECIDNLAGFQCNCTDAYNGTLCETGNVT